MNFAHWILLPVSFFILFFGSAKFLNSVNAATQSQTKITQVILPNKLGVSVPIFISFSPIFSNIDSYQITTSTINNIIVSNTRGGDSTGWSVSILCTDFIAINQAVKEKGKNDTVTSGGNYTGGKAGTYTITITKGGTVGSAKFKVSGLEEFSGITGFFVPIGTRGVTATFAKASYKEGDSWNIRIDTIPVSNLTITPVGLGLVSGKSKNAHLGPKHTFATRNDPASFLVVPEGQGSIFAGNLLLALKIPPFTYANTYKAMLTITSD